MISADLMTIGLGLSDNDRKEIIENVEIIYNLAATVRFDVTLTQAVLNNTRGCREMLTLAKQCKKLKVST